MDEITELGALTLKRVFRNVIGIFSNSTIVFNNFAIFQSTAVMNSVYLHGQIMKQKFEICITLRRYGVSRILNHEVQSQHLMCVSGSIPEQVTMTNFSTSLVVCISNMYVTHLQLALRFFASQKLHIALYYSYLTLRNHKLAYLLTINVYLSLR